MRKERFKTLLQGLGKGLYEKETELSLSLLAAIAGESVLLLGPPGVAKSMVARRVKCAFEDARSFEYLMSRFSTPDEIFGPVSIARLKEDDLYERNLEGFMPSADVVFLDEIWKAGPSILNTLLTIINEKTFRNGREELHVPLKLLIGASNELPANGEGLEALWDRFLVRIVSGCVKEEENFYHILTEESRGEAYELPEDFPSISASEYQQWQHDIAGLGIDQEVLTAISYIRKHLTKLRLDDNDESANRTHKVYVSDRRWQHIAHLLRASAFLHERDSVQLADLMPLVHCLWNEPDEIDAIRTLVVHAIMAKCAQKVEKLAAAISIAAKCSRIKQALQQSAREDYHRDDNKQLFDGFHYRIDNFGNGNTYIFFVDFKNMKDFSRVNAPLEGVIYPDPQRPQHKIIRTMADNMGMLHNGVAAQRVKLYRDNDNIYINGVKYPVHKLPPGMVQPPVTGLAPTTELEDFDSMIEALTEDIDATCNAIIYHNFFTSADDRKEMERQAKELNHRIAMLRIELQKIHYDGK